MLEIFPSQTYQDIESYVIIVFKLKIFLHDFRLKKNCKNKRNSFLSSPFYSLSIIFLDHLRVSCRHDAPLCLKIQCLFPKKQGILLHNNSAMIKIRKLILIQYSCLTYIIIQISPNVLIMSFITKENSRSCTPFGFLVFFVSFNLQ